MVYEVNSQNSLVFNSFFSISGIITDLYVDYYKLKAINVKSKVPKLIEVLDQYQYDRLLEFFVLGVPNEINERPINVSQ